MAKDAKEEEAKKLQQKYLEMQMIDQQAKHIQKQLQLIEQQVGEAEEVQQNLDALAKSTAGSPMLVPISSGIFVKATLADTKDLSVNVGAGTVVKKSVPETKELLAKQIIDMRKAQEELAAQFEKLARRGAEVEQELRALVG